MQNMPNQNLPPNNVVRRVQSYLKENNELLRKHKLIARLVIHFGEKKGVPLLSRIALWIVGKQGGKLDIQFGDASKK